MGIQGNQEKEYRVLSFLTAIMGVIVTILLAAIPWAYSVHGRLTQIETLLKSQPNNRVTLTELQTRVTRLELEFSHWKK